MEDVIKNVHRFTFLSNGSGFMIAPITANLSLLFLQLSVIFNGTVLIGFFDGKIN
jgi:hypothetical protein